MRVAVIGAGIAGLGTAWRLAEYGVGAVTVLEREPLPFTHSSARNAAIFRPLESNAAVVQLVQSSERVLTELTSEPLIRRSGVLLTAHHQSSLEALLSVAEQAHVKHELLTDSALFARYPELQGGRSTRAIWLPEGGVLDVHGLGEALRTRARQRGVELRLNSDVARILTKEHAVLGVALTSGEVIESDAVVIAAGAWAHTLGANVGAPVTLVPHRRHLALMLPTTDVTLPSTRPVVWDMETGIYFRPESAGVLACPGDHQPFEPSVPNVDYAVLETLASGLPDLCPALTSYAIARPWACLRTMTSSRAMAIGADPRLPGLYWFAGLGGQGMSAGLGGADALARLLAGLPSTEPSNPFAVEHHVGRVVTSATTPGAQP